MQFRLLGPLEVVGAQTSVVPGPGKEGALLAVLLLRANTPVSTEEIVDGLWGSAPPPNGAKSIHVYVSRLRKRLGARRVSTTPSGYVLNVELGELDSESFERFAEEGRGAIAAGEPAHAERLLSEALALWRGPALAEFRGEEFAQPEIRRLESLRDLVVADRIDARIALGQAERVITELESSISARPLWERPRAQLMLALYRSGRQADALDEFRTTRVLFNRELGIAPGPELQALERAILNQDASLDGPIADSEPSPPRPRPRRRPARAFALAAALLIAAAVAAGVAATRSHDGHAVVRVAPDSIAVIDPTSSRVTGQTRLVGDPSQVAVAGGLIWVWGDASHTLTALDPATLAVRRQLATGGFADQLTVARGVLWFLDGGERRLVAVNPSYGSIAARVQLPPLRPARRASVATARGSGSLTGVRAAALGGDLWVTDGGDGLLEIAAGSAPGRVIRRVDLHAPLNGVAAGGGAVWALSGARAKVFEIDPRSGDVRARLTLEARPSAAAPFPVAIAAGEGAIWVLDANAASVIRIDPTIGSVTSTIALGVGSDPLTLTVGAGAVWIADSGNGTVSRVDPVTDALTVVRVGGSPVGVAVAGSRVVVSVQPSLSGGGAAPAATLDATAAAELGALPTSFCSPVYYDGRDLPTALIVADLPLQGLGGLAVTIQMNDAVRYELSKAHFRAGRYRIGYQLCDDSSVQTGGWSNATCRRNGAAYAAAPRVLGVIGPFNSGCAAVEIPLAESSSLGPLAVIAPTATYVGLTTRGPGTRPDEPGRYYPRGVRNFVRVVANDEAQGAADAIVAAHLGVRGLYLLEDGSSYSTGLAAAIRERGRKLGLEFDGSAVWTSDPHRLRQLAARIAGTGADGVFIAGTVDEAGDALVQALRAALGPRETILTPDGFTPIEALLRAGAAADGVTVSVAEPDPDRLPKRGREFAAAFSAAEGAPTEPYSLSAAQSVDTLLAAIAHSDGTRASITERLTTQPTVGGILGSFHFDRAGDTTAGAVTVYRVERGKAVIWDVLQP